MHKLKSMNRLLTLLLAIILVVSVAVVPVSAAGEDDTYIYDRDANGQMLYTYQSPCTFSYISPKYPNGTWHQVFVFTMYNTRTGEHIPTYCTDVDIIAQKGWDYRRMNLEDSPFSGSAAGQIRRILTDGFYIIPIDGESDDAHAARVAAKTAELGKAAGVPDLTTGEAISATQIAIWQAAHGSPVTFTEFCRSVMSSINATKYANLCSVDKLNEMYDQGKGKALIDGRIEKVYEYLLSLPPIAASSMAVAPSSFLELHDPVITDNGNGTCKVEVTVKVKVDMVDGDSLTLSAKLGSNTSAEVTLSGGTQTKTLTLNNVPAADVSGDVKLSISGEQTVAGYFYFDAKGERNASQAMVAYDNSRVPVYAEVVAKENRVLNIKKTTKIDGATKPLEGIVFDIFPVATMEEYQTGAVVLPENAADYQHPALADYTLITDANGNASLDFTQHGLPDGIYLVVERNHPSIVAPIAPFYLSVPSYDAENGNYIYNITIKPKNTVKATVKIEKDVISVGNNEASVDAYVPHTWIIGASVPVDISNGKTYEITDTLDSRLDFLGGVKVALETTAGANVVDLIADEDYTLNVTDVDSLSEGNPSDSFKIALTAMGMNKIATAIGTESYSNYMLRVYFNAQINANAEMGSEIPNKAELKYVNAVNVEFDKESDVPVVTTGGINLLKVDATDETITLANATFEVYRPATAEEINAGGDNLNTITGVADKVVKVSFYDNAELEGEKVTSVTTEADGKAAIYGLAYGKYYLVETKAPAGYNLLAEPEELTIDAISHMDEKTITVENKMGAVLPSTGGVGTTIFTVSGIGLVCIACLFLYLNKRKMIET